MRVACSHQATVSLLSGQSRNGDRLGGARRAAGSRDFPFQAACDLPVAKALRHALPWLRHDTRAYRPIAWALGLGLGRAPLELSCHAFADLGHSDAADTPPVGFPSCELHGPAPLVNAPAFCGACSLHRLGIVACTGLCVSTKKPGLRGRVLKVRGSLTRRWLRTTWRSARRRPEWASARR